MTMIKKALPLLLSIFCVVVLHCSGQSQRRLPPNPCPDIFQYLVQASGVPYGLVTLPNSGAQEHQFAINTSFAIYTEDLEVDVRLLTDSSDVYWCRPLMYRIGFPELDLVPRITQIQYQQKIVCSGPPEPLLPGSGVTAVWSAYNFNNGVAGNCEDAPTTARSVQDRLPDINAYTNNPFLTRTTAAPPVMAPAINSRPKPAVSSSRRHECGVVPTRIQELSIGGTVASDGEFPWLAALFVRFPDGDGGDMTEAFLCTTTLITPKHVLTAASCVMEDDIIFNYKDEDLFVVLGTNDIANYRDNTNAVIKPVRKTIKNPDFKFGVVDSNLVYMELDGAVPYVDRIVPICVGWQVKLDELISTGGTIAGWGNLFDDINTNPTHSTLINKLHVPVVAQSTCYNTDVRHRQLVTTNTLCAGARDGKSACQSDLGSPIIVKRRNKQYLVGLIPGSLLTQQNDRCDMKAYIMLVNVLKYKKWLSMLA